MELHIYRVRIMPLMQRGLFASNLDPTTALRDEILRRPTVKLSRRGVWHIGNVDEIDESGLYFRIGRLSKLRVSIYDDSSQDFVEQEMQRAPYAHALLDWRRELVGIAKEPALAATTTSTSKRFKQLLNTGELATSGAFTFDVSAVSDPEGLLEALRDAYAITKFRYTVRRPNPWDADEAFVKPFEKLVQEAQAQKGNAEVSGVSLDVEPLEQITRSVAATGDDVRALIRKEKDAPAISQSLRGNTAAVAVSALDNKQERKSALDKLRERLTRIRNER
jgi:hypothetical protein